MTRILAHAFLTILAQSPESLSGGAGWVGAGLLGLVLFWLLLKHLPDKDKQLEKLLLSRDELTLKLLAQERESCEKRHNENLAEVKADRLAYERRHEALMTQHQQTHDENKELRHKVAGVESNIAVWVALVKQLLGGRLPSVPPPGDD